MPHTNWNVCLQSLNSEGSTIVKMLFRVVCKGTPVQKGTAAAISPVPVVTETPLGGGRWECTRHLPQMMVRGEHVVLVNVVERR